MWKCSNCGERVERGYEFCWNCGTKVSLSMLLGNENDDVKSNGPNGTATQAPKVFISYSRKDRSFVTALDEGLKVAGIQTWVDLNDIPFTAEWEQSVYTGIEATDACIFIISPDSLASEVCHKELDHAIKNSKRLVPVLCRQVDSKSAPPSLSKLNWVVFDGTNLGDVLPDLIKAVTTNLDYVQMHTYLLTRSTEWNNSGFDKNLLLRGKVLLEAEQWLARSESEKAPRPTPQQIDYVEGSRKNTKRLRRRLVLATLVGVSLLAIAGYLLVSLRARHKITSSQKLAAAAQSHLERDPDLSVALALKAVSFSRTAEAIEALRQSLISHHGRAVLQGHEGMVRSVEFSPDNRLLVTASDDGTARIWESSTGKNVAILRGHTGPVSNATFSPDGRFICTAGGDGKAGIWGGTDGQLIAYLSGHKGAVKSALFSPDGESILTASEDGTARIWDVASKEELIKLTSDPSPISSASFSPNGKLVITAAGNGAQIWDSATGRSVMKVELTNSYVEKAVFSPDGKLFATAGSDGIVRLWTADTAKQIGEIRSEVPSLTPASFNPLTKYNSPTDLVLTTGEGGVAMAYQQVKSFAIMVDPKDARGDRWHVRVRLAGNNGRVLNAIMSPSGTTAITTDEDHTAQLWRMSEGSSPNPILLSGHTGRVITASFSRDGEWVATASEDKTARVWRTRPDGNGKSLVGHSGAVTTVSFSPDGKSAVTASADKHAKTWDVVTGEWQKLGAPIIDRMHNDTVWSAVFCQQDSNLVLTGSSDGSVKVWDLRRWGGLQRDPVKEFKATWIATDTAGIGLALPSPVSEAVFSPDCRRVVASSAFSTLTHIWDAETGRTIAELKNDRIPSSPDGPGQGHLFFTRKGKWLISPGVGGVLISDTDTGEAVGQLPGAIFSLALSPNDNNLVSIGLDHNTAVIWDVDARRKIAELRAHTALILSADFSPDGEFVVTAGADKTAKVWEVKSANIVAELQGHSGEVVSARFSPDGRMVVTAGVDGIVRVWDAKTGQLLSNLPGHKDRVWTALFSPDGEYVMSAGQEHNARLYPRVTFATADELLVIATKRQVRGLSDAEQAEYLN
jgi:WD40 repeat protein